MGNDENTIKVSQRAEELGRSAKPYVDEMARQFREVWQPVQLFVRISPRCLRRPSTCRRTESTPSRGRDSHVLSGTVPM